MIRATLTLTLTLTLTICACQGEGTTPQPRPVTPEAGAPLLAEDGAIVTDPGDAPPPPPPEDAAPAEAQIEALGALPAWQAVVDRDRYLGRRGQHAVVYGVVGPAILIPGDAGAVPTGKYWLVDDSEGHGTLAIRIAWPAKGPTPGEGDRVAAGGAWTFDDQRQWFWQIDNWSSLPPGPPSAFPESPAPPHHIVGSGSPPAGWKPVAAAKDDGVIVFQVVGAPPVNEGDGWKVANELGDAPAAILFLPGERPSYGGHDMRAADEKWQLKRGVGYWVRIGKVRRRAPDQPATINARTAPMKW